MNKEVIELLLANRLYLYELGNKIYGGVPNKEFLDILSGEQTVLAFDLLSEGDQDVYAKTCQLLEKIRERTGDEQFVDFVKAEFMHVIEGPGKLKAYPWASTFLGKEKMLFQECTLTVRNTYKKFGMQTVNYPKVADDHIALEMHFMARMSKLAQDAFLADDIDKLTYYLSGQAEFLRAHMTYWVPMYNEAMKENGDAEIYPRLTEVYTQFLRDDLEAVDEILNSFKN